MNSKTINSPKELADWFKSNETLQKEFPATRDFIMAHDNLGKGCSCKKNAKFKNLHRIFAHIISILKSHEPILSAFKECMEIDELIINIPNFSQQEIKL